MNLEKETMNGVLKRAIGSANLDILDAHALAVAVTGDAIAANMIMVGYAFQKGLIPLRLESFERAVELNAVAVEANKTAFNWGRMAAHNPEAIAKVMSSRIGQAQPTQEGLAEKIARRVAFLTEYQDENYGARYRSVVDRIIAAERRNAKGQTGLADAVALNLFKLMAYKDEYEVARLYVNGVFDKALKSQFDGDFKLQFHLAPPILTKRDPLTGEAHKRTFGPWVVSVFRVLARLRWLRGTSFDIFGRTQERRMERQLIVEYEALLGEIAEKLQPGNHAQAVRLAQIPAQIRGFGHVKERSVTKARQEQNRLLLVFREDRPVLAAAISSQAAESGALHGARDPIPH
jgi:indolepyruvate ferredoxin oxidoreductase